MTEALPQDDNGIDDGVDDEIYACLNLTEPKVFFFMLVLVLALAKRDHW